MIVPSLSTWFTELVFCALLIVAVRAVCGQWFSPGAKRLLWGLLILKALVPFAVPTAYYPLGTLHPGTVLRSVPGSFVLLGVWFCGFVLLLGVAMWRNRSVVLAATKKPVLKKINTWS